MSRIVIALGGNALGSTPSQQKQAVKITAKSIVDLFKKNHEIIVVHGNGPQVGSINNALSAGFKNGVIAENFAFPECGAMSQGYIGYHLQNAIFNELSFWDIEGSVSTIISQVEVDINDQAFKNPSKPIGLFMDEHIAKSLAIKNHWVVKEDAGRGWRRVVPSPRPMKIIENDMISKLISNKRIIIAGGGGGIPVYRKTKKLYGIDAVIDKDATAAKIAIDFKADQLLILTAVDQVKLDYGKATEKSLVNVNVKELKKYIDKNEFAPGSMLPKIESAIKFVTKTGQEAVIGNLKNVAKILKGISGTKITT